MATNIDYFQVLRDRCKNGKIEFEEQEGDEELPPYLAISLKAGRKKRHVFFQYDSEVEEFLKINFEKFFFLDRYDAIYSPEEKTIEALIYPLQGSIHTIYGGILSYKRTGENIDRNELPNLKLIDTKDKNHTVSIGPCSSEFELITQNKVSLIQKYPPPTIKLKGFNVDSHIHAKRTLEKISQSLFFQIDLKYKTPINLAIYSSVIGPFFRSYRSKVKLNYPNRAFDKDALSLYWYAKKAKNMPLQKYLSFYQVLEFFFSNFVTVSVKKKVKNLLSDPSFNIDKDHDLNKVVGIVESNSSYKIDERSQLNLTLKECIDASELKDFFAPKATTDFFSKRNKEITEVTIPFNDKNADIIKVVANRVYDIRCRIVHTKDISGTTKPLLPNSKGAEKLTEDVKLLEFLAKKVIIGASSPLNI